MARPYSLEHYSPSRRWIRIPTLKLVYFSFVSTYHTSYASDRILATRVGEIHNPMTSKLFSRPHEGLWTFYQGPLVPTFAVTRNRCWRRTRSALIEELRKRGWNKDGKRAGNGIGSGAGRIYGLYGTLDIIVKPAVAIAEWVELRRQMGLIVEKLEEICENRNGKRVWSTYSQAQYLST